MTPLEHLLGELRHLQETPKKLYSPLMPPRKPDQTNPDMYRRQNGRCPWRTQFVRDDHHPNGGSCVRVGPTRVSVEKWANNSLVIKQKRKRLGEAYAPMSIADVIRVAENHGGQYSSSEVDNAFVEAEEQDFLRQMVPSRGMTVIELFAENPNLSESLFRHIYDSLHNYAPTKQIKGLQKGTIRHLQQSLLRNPAMPQDFFWELFTSMDSSVSSGVRDNPLLPLIMLERPSFIADIIERLDSLSGPAREHAIHNLQHLGLMSTSPLSKLKVRKSYFTFNPEGDYLIVEEYEHGLFFIYRVNPKVEGETAARRHGRWATNFRDYSEFIGANVDSIHELRALVKQRDDEEEERQRGMFNYYNKKYGTSY